jgi:hypothetical protein
VPLSGIKRVKRLGAVAYLFGLVDLLKGEIRVAVGFIRIMGLD